jgi:uncharacterized SAM-binding protein YcdF (DUF218 family)
VGLSLDCRRVNLAENAGQVWILMAMLWKRLALAAGLILLISHFFAFLHGDLFRPTDLPRKRYDVAVVFTGAYDRVDRALDLLQAGAVKRVFISGANPNAGIWLDRFTAQFGRGRDDLARLIACCVTFGEAADTTLENAAETECWLKGHDIRDPVLLVTSWDHMPRAHAALAALIGGSRITAFPVGGATVDDALELRRLVLEYAKYWGTRLMTWAPRAVVAESYGPFRDGCPRSAT